MPRRTLLIALLAVLTCAAVQADVRLPAILGDHMVLQRDTEVPLWGWADPGERVSVQASWQPDAVEATADADGHWRVTIHTPGAGGPHTITIAGENVLTLREVLIGEVWICSGQSNMEWSFASGVPNREQELATANQPHIRLFNVNRKLAAGPLEDCEGQWQECTSKSVFGFSAVGYFFGREIHQELNVPVGLIGSSWGGTVAEAWMSPESLRRYGGFDDRLKQLEAERAAPGTLAKTRDLAVQRWWEGLTQLDAGSAPGGWMQPDFADADWAEMRLPTRPEADGLGNFDGVIWYRRTFDAMDEWTDRALTLELGPIDDMDTVWINGQRIGGTERAGAYQLPRKYTVPAGVVKPKNNVIAVRVVDTGGPGGFFGQPAQLALHFSDGKTSQAVALAGTWQCRAGARISALPPFPWQHSLHANWPSVLYNGMIAPLTPFAIRGAIWYQGEANRPRPIQYQTLFPALIRDWRELWGRGDFPFYFVQIAPFRYQGDTGDAAALRDAQRRTLSVPNTGMAVTMDIGNPNDIHPRNKQDVGHRLALWALAKTYGRDGLVYSGPLYRSMDAEEGRIRLHFDHADGGLRTDGPLDFFLIAGRDRSFVRAKARIEGETVVVWSEAAPDPIAVRYAWGPADEPSLFNKVGLPAACFRTDNWSEVSVVMPPDVKLPGRD